MAPAAAPMSATNVAPTEMPTAIPAISAIRTAPTEADGNARAIPIRVIERRIPRVIRVIRTDIDSRVRATVVPARPPVRLSFAATVRLVHHRLEDRLRYMRIG